MGKALGTPCVTNVWIPDGMKDTPVDRLGPRERLVESLDEMFAEPLDRDAQPRRGRRQAVRPRLESYVVGSHEFYLGYALSRRSCSASTPATITRPRPSPTRSARCCCSCRRSCCTSAAACAGTATTSSLLNDDLAAIGQELVRGDFLDRTHIGLDYFDASINRVAAWVDRHAEHAQGAARRAARADRRSCARVEAAGDYTARLALLEEFKTLPFGAVWDYYCERQSVPAGGVLAGRGQALRSGRAVGGA